MDSKVKLGIAFAIIFAVIVSSGSNLKWSFLLGQDTNTEESSQQNNSNRPSTLNLGYFPNLNLAQAIIGIGNGNFSQALSSNDEDENTTINPRLFNSGASIVDALYSGQIDVAYIGPNSAIDGYILTGADDLRIISGVSSGGASFVVRNDSGIRSADDLGGKKFASPQLGNTQDVALRKYLIDNGFNTVENGGNVTVVALKPTEIITQFQNREIDGAWVPEPIVTILKQQAKGVILVEEKDLWPDGKFVTGNIIVRTDYLRDNPDVIKKLLEAHVEQTLWINEKINKTNNTNLHNYNKIEIVSEFNKSLKNITGKTYPDNQLYEAFSRIEFTIDPLPKSLIRIAEDASAYGFITNRANWNAELSDIHDLKLLNEVLIEKGLKTIN